MENVTEQGTSDLLRNVRTALDENQFSDNDFEVVKGDDYESENEVTVVSLIKDHNGYTCEVQSEIEPPKALNLSMKPEDVEAQNCETNNSPKLKIILPLFTEEESSDSFVSGTDDADVNDEASKEYETETVLVANNSDAEKCGRKPDTVDAIVISSSKGDIIKQSQVTAKVIENSLNNLRIVEHGQSTKNVTLITARANESNQSTIRVKDQYVKPQENMERKLLDRSNIDLRCYESSTDLDKEIEFGETLRLPSVSDLNRAIRVSGNVTVLDGSPTIPVSGQRSRPSRSHIKIVNGHSLTAEQARNKELANGAVSIIALSSTSTDRESALVAAPIANSSTIVSEDGIKTNVPGFGPVATLPAAQYLIELAASAASKGGNVAKAVSTSFQGSVIIAKPSISSGIAAPTSLSTCGQPNVSIMHVQSPGSAKAPMLPLSLKPGVSVLPVANNSSSRTLQPKGKSSPKQKPVFVSKPFKLPTAETGTSQVFFVNMTPDGKILARSSKPWSDKTGQSTTEPMPKSGPSVNVSSADNTSRTPSSETTKSNYTAPTISKPFSTGSPIPTPKSVIEVIFSAASNIIGSKFSDSISSGPSNTKMTFTLPKSCSPANQSDMNAFAESATKLLLDASKGSGSTAVILPNASSSSGEQSKPLRNEPPNAIPGTTLPYRTPGSMKTNRHGNIKRPMNAFMVWARRFRPKLSAQMATATNAEISMSLGQIWNQMPEPEKTQYYAEAERIKLMHKLTYPDWSYKPKVRKIKHPSQTPSPPGRIVESTVTQFQVIQSEPFVPTSVSSTTDDIVREYTLERSDGNIGTLKGRPPSMTTRTNDAQTDTGSSYSVVHGWKEKENGGEVTTAQPVLSETSLATQTLAGINDYLDGESDAMDLTVGRTIVITPQATEYITDDERKKRIRDEIEAAVHEKRPKRPRKSSPSDKNQNGSRKNKRNTPRTRNTRMKTDQSQSYITTASQTDSPSISTWPFPFSSYPLNEHYAERAQSANARNQPLKWDNTPYAGQSISSSSLPDCDPYHPLFFENNQRLRVHGLNMQRWIDYMNRTDDRNFTAFHEGARSESNTSLASCSQIMENVMSVESPANESQQEDCNRGQKRERNKSVKQRGNGRQTARKTNQTAQTNTTEAQDIMNSMYERDNTPFLPSVMPSAPGMSQSWTDLPTSGEVIVDAYNPEQDVTYYGSFADLGFCEVDISNTNNSSARDIPWWHHARHFGANRSANLALLAHLAATKANILATDVQDSSTKVASSKGENVEGGFSHDLQDVPEEHKSETTDNKDNDEQNGSDEENYTEPSEEKDYKETENKENVDAAEERKSLNDENEDRQIERNENDTSRQRHEHNTRRESRFKAAKKWPYLAKLMDKTNDNCNSGEAAKPGKENRSSQNDNCNREPEKKKRGRGRPKKFKSGKPVTNTNVNNPDASKENKMKSSRTSGFRDDSDKRDDYFVVPAVPAFDPRRVPINPHFRRLPAPNWRHMFLPPQAPRRSLMPYTSMPPPLRYMFSRSYGQNEAIDLSVNN